MHYFQLTQHIVDHRHGTAQMRVLLPHFGTWQRAERYAKRLRWTQKDGRVIIRSATVDITRIAIGR